VQGGFDLIIFSHVLEHLLGDEKALKWVHKYLVSNGSLVLMVPNEGAKIYKISRMFSPLAVRKSDHVNFYTEKSLRQLVKSTGWAIITLEREQIIFPQSLINLALISNKITFHIMKSLVKWFPNFSNGFQVLLKKRREHL